MQALNGGGTAQCCVGADDIDCALQQLTDRDRGVEYIVVANRRKAEVGFQPVQVAQQAQVGVCDALPVGNTQVQRTAQQAADHRVEEGGAGAVHSDCRTADGQRRQRRGTGGHGGGADRHIGWGGRLFEQCANAGCNAAWHRMSRDHLDSQRLRRVGDKYARPCDIHRKCSAAGHQGAAIGIRDETVARGALISEIGRRGGCAAARASTARRFQCGNVRNPLQRALFQIQPAAVDNGQRAQQCQAHGQRRHQADRAALPGGHRRITIQWRHQHSFDHAIAHSFVPEECSQRLERALARCQM
ncbi:hypothetical protein ALP25_05518 [Pseudomonas syringae pv. syringae]|nr:hypothetical protein ALP25_05518 [Pseudomonas syringae pv. syringae]